MTSRALRRLLLSPPACRDPRALRAAVAGRTVAVTGASSGIGRATALLLGAAGAEVLLLARRTAELERVQAEIGAHGGRAHVYPLDLADPQAVQALAAHLLTRHPRLHALISNAGKSVRRPVGASADRRDLDRQLAVNFTGPAALTLALLPALTRAGGVIVNVSSVSARPPGVPRWAGYQGSKAGFDLWLHSLGAELRADGVRVSSVYLPLTRTPMIAPTRAYRFLPALTPHEAAQAVVRPLVHPELRVAPWWLTGQELAALLAPAALQRLLGALERGGRRFGRQAQR